MGKEKELAKVEAEATQKMWQVLIDKIKNKESLVTKEDFQQLHENAKKSEKNSIKAYTMARNYQVR